MGQHKYNPIAKLAREGKIPPKKPKMGKRESARLLKEEMTRLLLSKLHWTHYQQKLEELENDVKTVEQI